MCKKTQMIPHALPPHSLVHGPGNVHQRQQHALLQPWHGRSQGDEPACGPSARACCTLPCAHPVPPPLALQTVYTARHVLARCLGKELPPALADPAPPARRHQSPHWPTHQVQFSRGRVPEPPCLDRIREIPLVRKLHEHPGLIQPASRGEAGGGAAAVGRCSGSHMQGQAAASRAERSTATKAHPPADTGSRAVRASLFVLAETRTGRTHPGASGPSLSATASTDAGGLPASGCCGCPCVAGQPPPSATAPPPSPLLLLPLKQASPALPVHCPPANTTRPLPPLPAAACAAPPGTADGLACATSCREGPSVRSTCSL